MKWFLDTSVLFPVFLVDHPHHRQSLALYKQCSRESASCAAHSLAEVYSTLTRIPPPHRVSPGEALEFLGDIHGRLQLISLNGEAYIRLIQEAARNRVVGGAIYDAIIGQCALQANSETLYTWNERHFHLLGSEVLKRLKTPAAIA